MSGKKISVITGSPRKNGNSFAMTNAFIWAGSTKSHAVVRFDAAFKKLTAAKPVKLVIQKGYLVLLMMILIQLLLLF